MKLNDKCKELADNWVEWGNCYKELNQELELKKPSALKVKEILDKKEKLTRKRDVILKELQTLVDKTSADIKIKFDKVWG
ncbi:hypothetical protein [Methanobrevibacter sp.]|uniref:hypothetical protein n=1 Tax=Methanobrevibacter sp. TaxID=66852 RepID=UPI00386D22D5